MRTGFHTGVLVQDSQLSLAVLHHLLPSRWQFSPSMGLPRGPLWRPGGSE